MLAEAADLYAVAPEGFVAARNALAKQLRADGRRDDAQEVARLRRPSRTAWALNRLAREQPALVDRVLGSVAGLRSAVERALGGEASDVRAAQTDERTAVEEAAQAAAAYVNGDDRARQLIQGTLRAAGADVDIAAELRAGTLAADHPAPAFGLEGLQVPSAPRARHQPPPKETAEDRRARAELERLKERADRLEAAAADAERRAAEARAAADDARRAVDAFSDRPDRRATPTPPRRS